MFFNKNTKSEFETLLEDIEDKQHRTTVYRAFNPARASLAWLQSSGLKFDTRDVINLAALVKQDLQ